MIVVDASAAIELVLATPTGAAVAGRLFDPGETLHAPELIDLEVAQALRRYERAKLLDATRAGDDLSAAAEFARRSRADLILRVTVKSARVRDLGRNDATTLSTIVWFLVPAPVWFSNDRTYDTNVSVEAALYEPRDTVKPTATVVAAAGRQELDLWDRGLSPYVIFVPPPCCTVEVVLSNSKLRAGSCRSTRRPPDWRVRTK